MMKIASATTILSAAEAVKVGSMLPAAGQVPAAAMNEFSLPVNTTGPTINSPPTEGVDCTGEYLWIGTDQEGNDEIQYCPDHAVIDESTCACSNPVFSVGPSRVGDTNLSDFLPFLEVMGFGPGENIDIGNAQNEQMTSFTSNEGHEFSVAEGTTLWIWGNKNLERVNLPGLQAASTIRVHGPQPKLYEFSLPSLQTLEKFEFLGNAGALAPIDINLGDVDNINECTIDTVDAIWDVQPEAAKKDCNFDQWCSTRPDNTDDWCQANCERGTVAGNCPETHCEPCSS